MCMCSVECFLLKKLYQFRIIFLRRFDFFFGWRKKNMYNSLKLHSLHHSTATTTNKITTVKSFIINKLCRKMANDYIRHSLIHLPNKQIDATIHLTMQFQRWHTHTHTRTQSRSHVTIHHKTAWVSWKCNLYSLKRWCSQLFDTIQTLNYRNNNNKPN